MQRDEFTLSFIDVDCLCLYHVLYVEGQFCIFLAEDIFQKFALQCCKLTKVIVKCEMYRPPREIKGNCVKTDKDCVRIINY